MNFLDVHVVLVSRDEEQLTLKETSRLDLVLQLARM